MAAPTINDEDLELGPVNLYQDEKARASKTTSLTGTHNDLIFRAQDAYLGTPGNAIEVAYVNNGSDTALEISVDGTEITVQLEVNSGGVIQTIAQEILDAVNADPQAFFLTYAALASGNDGSGVVTAMVSGALSGGSETTTRRFLGALGETTTLNVMTEDAPLTAHLSGKLARDKRIIGGGLQITGTLKEITLRNMALAFANTLLIQGADGAERLEMILRTGTSARQTKGTKIILIRVRAGIGESTDPADRLTIPICSPVATQGGLGFSAIGAQQEIPFTLEAWPNSRGLLAYWGPDAI